MAESLLFALGRDRERHSRPLLQESTPFVDAAGFTARNKSVPPRVRFAASCRFRDKIRPVIQGIARPPRAARAPCA